MFYADVKLSHLRFLRGEDRSKMFENSFVESGISGSHDDEYEDDCLWEIASFLHHGFGQYLSKYI
jgi:hypothetical protein